MAHDHIHYMIQVVVHSPVSDAHQIANAAAGERWWETCHQHLVVVIIGAYDILIQSSRDDDIQLTEIPNGFPVRLLSSKNSTHTPLFGGVNSRAVVVGAASS